MPRQGERVRRVAHRRQRAPAEELHRHRALPGGEIELGELHEAGEVGDDEDHLVLVAADEGQDARVVRPEQLQAPPPEGGVALAQRDQALGPPEQRSGAPLLRLHVDRLVVVVRIDDHREHQALGVGAGEAGVLVGAPLHGRAHAVAIAQVDVVPHADLVAVVEDRRPRQREEQGVHQLDVAALVARERRQAAADAQVDAHHRLGGVSLDHGVALLVGDHLQRELVVVPEEERPLAPRRDRWGLRQDVGEGEAVLQVDGHEDARHHREVERHVALVAAPEVGHRVLGPLVGLGEEHPALEARVHVGAQLAQERVRLRQVLARGPLALEEVGHRVEPEPVDPHPEPVRADLQHRRAHLGAVVVEVRLVGVEAVPVVRPGDRIPRPVGGLVVLEDDPRLAEPLRRVAPHVELPLRAPRRRPPRPLEPGVLVRRVVEDELGDDPEPPPVRLVEEALEVRQGAILGVDAHVVGDVVAVVPLRRGIEGQEPERGDAEILEVVELLAEPAEVARAVAVAVVVRADAQLVDDRVPVPVRPPRQRRRRARAEAHVGGSLPRGIAAAGAPGKRRSGRGRGLSPASRASLPCRLAWPGILPRS